MKRYSRVLPPHCWMSSPAAHADPPVAMRSLWDKNGSEKKTCSSPQDDLLDDDTVLPRLDSICLHLKLVYSVFLFIRDDIDLSRQLSDLSNGHKGSAESQGEDRSQEETTCVQTDNDVDLAGRGGFLELGKGLREDVVGQVGNEGFGSERVSENRLQAEIHQLQRLLVYGIIRTNMSKKVMPWKQTRISPNRTEGIAFDSPSWESPGGHPGGI